MSDYDLDSDPFAMYNFYYDFALFEETSTEVSYDENGNESGKSKGNASYDNSFIHWIYLFLFLDFSFNIHDSLSINLLNLSPVAVLVELTLLTPVQLLLEHIDMLP